MLRPLPNASTQYVKIPDAKHFSFMSQRPRPVIQQQVITLISEFLAR